MVSYVTGGGIHGIECFLVRVESDVSDGLPVLEFVGFLASEVKESKERVRTALKNSGFILPVKRMTVNLSPAGIKKSGTGFDLPIALSLLQSMMKIPGGCMEDTFVAGELLLSGQIRRINGILPMVIEAKKNGLKKCIVPKENMNEAALVEGIDVYGAVSLKGVVEFLRGGESEDVTFLKGGADNGSNPKEDYSYDLANVQGQENARRGLEIAAAGLHNMMMIGPPGAGKTLLAKCIPSILPKMSKEECLEVSAIYSVAGKLRDDKLMTVRPFVEPHHSTSMVGLIGGGGVIRPGSVSLSDKGVLFMDEFPEFSRESLEALRQPLEERQVHIIRNRDSLTFPADFMLVAAMNPCPCGAYPNLDKCECTLSMRRRYLGKVSKPVLDRIDICIQVERVNTQSLLYKSHFESSATVRKRIEKAHLIQSERFKDYNISLNSQMNNELTDRFCKLYDAQKKMMEFYLSKYDLSARGYYRILKVARTIADLDESEIIKEEHLSEALRMKMSSDILGNMM